MLQIVKNCLAYISCTDDCYFHVDSFTTTYFTLQAYYIFNTFQHYYLTLFNISAVHISIKNSFNYARTGSFIGVGIFTITEVKSGQGSPAGWGRLKSGAGRISLDYAKRI